jgi:hypothetical protein
MGEPAVTTDPRTQLADAVTALVDPIQHVETYPLRSAYPDGRAAQEIHVWRTVHPSLLDQLATAVEPSASANDGSRGYESSPSASLEAIYVRMRIERESADWLWHLTRTVRDTVVANLRALVGAPATVAELKTLAGVAGRWVTWARIATKWDVPPRRIPAPCMACEARDTLRARGDTPATIVATCYACGEVWSGADGTIYVLGEHVKRYNHEDADTGELEKVAG